MTNLLRLLLAVVFGAIALAINWLWMSSERDYPMYVAVVKAVPFGEAMTKENLQAVPVKGDPDVLNKTLVPWDQKELWFGRPATRDYAPSDLLFQRDMIQTAGASKWDYLGPFKLIGVGSDPTAALTGRSGVLTPTSAGGSVLTLAIDDAQASDKELLYRYLAAMRGEYYFNESPEEKALLHIIALEPKVPEGAAAAASKGDTTNTAGTDVTVRLNDARGDRLIFVSIDKVPNVPTFLRIGQEIYFTVPPGKERLLRKELATKPAPASTAEASQSKAAPATSTPAPQPITQ